ncbi:MAG: hypothetical protein JWP80_1970 [Pseudomonas sp.]|nr:hypothetical protein [Pseudomonas sp.]
MKESDWKLLSKLRPLAVDRLYDRILQEVQAAVNGEGKTSRELVQETREAVDDGLDRVYRIFDAERFSRNNARFNLMFMCRADLLTEEDVSGFSDEVREDALKWLGPDDE